VDPACDSGARAPQRARASTPGPANLEHRHLRSALEFAVGIAAAGQRLKPPLTSPAELRPFLRAPRLPGGALGKVRRVVDADAAFRQRLAVAATPELVDPIGMEWLQRTEGWKDRVAALVDEEALADADEDAMLALKRAERRRDAAEQLAVRTRAELAALTQRLGEFERRLGERSSTEGGYDAVVADLKAQLVQAKLDARHANDRAAAAALRLETSEAERDAATERAAAAERQRDELLAARAELAGVSVPAMRLSELREIAEAAKTITEQLKALVDVGGVTKRQPLGVPGSLARDPRKAAEFLLRAPSVLVLVDGYNVAKLAWPEAELESQRELLLDAVDGVARRFGAEIVVVFDGAEVTGSHTRRRRLARVRYSPAGVIADDVIRAEVAGAAPTRPIVVVTNDVAVRRDVAADGANLIASETFTSVALS
jgi:hypothetical protein